MDLCTSQLPDILLLIMLACNTITNIIAVQYCVNVMHEKLLSKRIRFYSIVLVMV